MQKKPVKTTRVKIRIIRKTRTVCLNQDSSQPGTTEENLPHPSPKFFKERILVSVGLYVMQFIHLI